MKGDWYCKDCGVLNFASRTECFKCNGTSKKEDWVCKCKELNFSYRTDCRACGCKRIEIVKKNDWKCLECDEINFSFRLKCRKCQLPYGTTKPKSKDQTQKQQQCIICCDNPRDTAIKLCGHFGFCAMCASTATTCSVCRQEYDPENDLVTIYTV